MGELRVANTSTSAIPTSRRVRPLPKSSAYSIWSRSLESSLSIEDQSNERRSRTLPSGATTGGCASICATCCCTAAGNCGSNPRARTTCSARMRRSTSEEDWFMSHRIVNGNVITIVAMNANSYHNADSLISTEELARTIGSKNVKIVEAGFDMPGSKPPFAREKYVQAHVPGAVFFDIDEVADKKSSLPHMIPSAEEFADAVGKLGIGNEDRVIVYDREGLRLSPRAWWMFRTFGHDNVAVLNGGLQIGRA